MLPRPGKQPRALHLGISSQPSQSHSLSLPEHSLLVTPRADGELFYLVVMIAAHGSREALDQATMAYFKQTGIDQRLEQYGRTLIDEQTQRKLSNAAIATRILVERSLLFTWRF